MPCVDLSAVSPFHDSLAYVGSLEMISIRLANERDVETLCSLDLAARSQSDRREFIKRSIASCTLYVAMADNEVIGYGVLNYTFYRNGFIEMLYVHSDHRRLGAATTLLRHMESLCETSKLFVSTNLSNAAMQSLLIKSNYVLSGLIHNLDEGDPEIVYFKRLR
jgi:ribosomal protein S18 acetylase RimI-like enzyme